MGQEVTCVVRANGATGRAVVLLETDQLVVRRPLSMVVPFASLTSVTADGAWLRLTHAAGDVSLELGAVVAARWAERIRHPPSRLQKIGLQAGQRVAVVGTPDDTFVSELTALGVRVSRRMPTPGSGVDAVVLTANGRRDLSRVPAAAAALAAAGALWVVRPKGTQAITEAETGAAGLAAGLVDVKVVSFSAQKTAEKFVIPVSRRGGGASARATAGRSRKGSRHG